MPEDTLEEDWCSTLTESPRPSSVLVASDWLWPVTLGMVMPEDEAEAAPSLMKTPPVMI